MIALLLIAIALIAALSGPVTPSADAADSKGPKTLLGSIFGSSGRQDGHEEEERLDPDRPHFPEATTTVGKGRVILESGYTFTEKRSSFSSQTYPEALLRVGMFAEWFEFRVGQNFLRQEQTVAGTTTRESGAQDLYLGVKLALIEQDGYVPQIALIPQMTVPTGSKGVTAGRVLPGVNVDFSWEIVKDLFDVELLIATNSVADGNLESHVEVATGLRRPWPSRESSRHSSSGTPSTRWDPAPTPARGTTPWAGSSTSSRRISPSTFGPASA